MKIDQITHTLENEKKINIHDRGHEVLFEVWSGGKVKMFRISEHDIFEKERGRIKKLAPYLDGSSWKDRIVSSLLTILNDLGDDYDSAGALRDQVIEKLKKAVWPDISDGTSERNKENHSLQLGKPVTIRRYENKTTLTWKEDAISTSEELFKTPLLGLSNSVDDVFERREAEDVEKLIIRWISQGLTREIIQKKIDGKRLEDTESKRFWRWKNGKGKNESENW